MAGAPASRCVHQVLLIHVEKAVSAADIVPFLKLLARASGRVIVDGFNRPDLEVEWKEDETPVTWADRKAEELIREHIQREFPDHGLIGEEFPDVRPDAEYNWVIDPIDGTKAFTTGSPHFGTLICLRRGSSPLWSAINLPAVGRLLIGNNDVAWCDDRPIRVRETVDLADCMILTTDPRTPPVYHDPRGWEDLLAATGEYRSWGDCFGYALLAMGKADIMCDPILNLWDVAALLPILRGAGAAVSDWKGGPPDTATSLVAANPVHHAEVIRLLNRNP